MGQVVTPANDYNIMDSVSSIKKNAILTDTVIASARAEEAATRPAGPLDIQKRAAVILSLACLLGPMTMRADVPPPAAEVSVTDFGAEPDDGQDDSKGIQAAIEHCRMSQCHRLVLPRGRYDFSEAQLPAKKRAFGFQGFNGITVDGNGSTLLFRGRVNPFCFEKCRDVVLKNVVIDWERPYFSQGKVLRADGLTFEVKVDANYPVDGTEKFEALMDYDPETRFPIGNIDILANSGIASCRLLRPQVLQITLKQAKDTKFTKRATHFLDSMKKLPGKLLVLRHVVYGNYGVDLIECPNSRLENVTIYSVPGMGIHAQQCGDVSLRRVQVRIRPDSGGLMSTTADCQFYTHCTGTISIEDSYFEGMGDDGLNVTAKYRTVSKIVNRNTIEAIYVAPFWRGPTPRPGEKLEFSGSRDLLFHGDATVKTASWDNEARIFRIELTEPLAKVTVGDYLAVQTYLPKVRVLRSTFRGMRARAMLFSTRDVLVENCNIEAPAFAGIMLMGGMRSGFQGPATRQVVIRNNSFDGCGGAAVYVDASVPAPGIGAHRDLTIEGNTIRENPHLATLRFKKDNPNWVYWNSAICLTAIDGVVIRSNTVSGYHPAVFLANAANVEITGNTFTDDTTLVINPKEAGSIHEHGNHGLTVETTASAYDFNLNYINILR